MKQTPSVEKQESQMTRRHIFILVTLLASQFVLAADFSVLNVALPQIGAEVGIGVSGIQWIITAYTLGAASCTLVFGRLGDYVGHRRVFISGMAVLVLASIIGGTATTSGLILTARALQGLSTAAITPASLALLTVSFQESKLRTRALGLNGVMLSLGFSVGAVLGGIITDALSWRWAFFINIPVALAAIAAIPFLVNESKGKSRRKIDISGAVLITVALLTLILSVTRMAESGIDSLTVSYLAAAGFACVAFYLVERQAKDALIPVQILKIPTLALSNFSAILLFGGESAVIFFTVLYVQNVLSLSPLAAGFVLLSIGAGQFLTGLLGPYVIAKTSPKTVLCLGLIGQGLFMTPLALLSTGTGSLVLLLFTEFFGASLGMLAVLAFMVVAVSSVESNLQGMASGLATQSQQIGGAIGIPMLSAVFVAVVGNTATGHQQIPGFHMVFLVDGIASALVGAIVFLAWREQSVR